MSQNWQFQMGADRSNAGQQQLGDTTYTKIFVGGLAWETRRETMRRYFEQFGEILEAVVITDKNTGRSKGYGFVTFKDPDSAIRACQDPSPVIDGRRANCNLASLGARPPRPSTPQYGVGRYRPVIPGSAPALYHGTSTAYFNQNTQYPFPNSAYGYSGYSQENMYPMVSNLGTHILNSPCSNSISFVACPKLQMGGIFGGLMKSLQMRWGVVWTWGYLITQFKYVPCYHFPHISSPSKRSNNEFLPSQAQISTSTHCLRLES